MKPLNFYGEKLKGPRALHTVDSKAQIIFWNHLLLLITI